MANSRRGAAAEEKSLRKKLDAAKAEEAGLVKALGRGEMALLLILRLAQLEDEAARQPRPGSLRSLRSALQRPTRPSASDLTAALGLFTPVVYPAEPDRAAGRAGRGRTEAGTLAVTFTPTGIKALAARRSGGRARGVEVQVDWGRVAGNPRQDNPLNLAPPRSRAKGGFGTWRWGGKSRSRVASGEFSS